MLKQHKAPVALKVFGRGVQGDTDKRGNDVWRLEGLKGGLGRSSGEENGGKLRTLYRKLSHD